VEFTDDERCVLDRIAAEAVRSYAAREDLDEEGRQPVDVKLILAGWACRYKILADGRRQIIGFFLPGDICELHVEVLKGLDHSVAAITPVAVAQIKSATLNLWLGPFPRISQALNWEQVVAASTQREWTVNVGQRSAFERMSHLLCELFVRMQSIGLVKDRRCELPLTQADLADATGLSAIHANRIIQEMRARGLIALGGKELYVPDLLQLKEASSFNSNYLHVKD
jgi:CRP-like cAMP-binding protein